MGCVIYIFVEIKKDGHWIKSDAAIFPNPYRAGFISAPFSWRQYGMYGVLANVRNSSEVPTIAPRKGFPEDASEEVKEEWREDPEPAVFRPSWLTVKELLDFDYNQTFLNKDNGRVLSVREHLGENYFSDLQRLATLGAPEDVRIVFWFDD